MTSGGDAPGAARRDIVAWLTVYVVLLYAVPSRLVVGPLNSAGAPSMLVGLASAVLWLLLRIRRSTPDSRSQPVTIALSAFVVSVALSYVAAMMRPIDADEISPADVALLSAVSWSGTLLIAHDGLRTLADVRTVVRRFVTVGSALAILGLTQFLTDDPIVDRLSIPGLTSRGASGTFVRDGLTRVAGTATHPIEFGALLTIMLPLALHQAFFPGGGGVIRRWAPTALIGGALAISLSRTVYVGVGVAFGVLLLGWTARQRRVALTGAVAAFVAAVALYPRLLSSITGLFQNPAADPSISSRTDSYGFALEFFQRNPLVGRGMGTFLPKYRIFDNQYLGMLVSIGLVGTLAFLAILVAALLVLRRVRRTTTDPATRDLALSLTASLAVGAVSFAFFDAFSFPMTAGTLFLVVGLAGALARTQAQAGLGLPSDPTAGASANGR